MRSIRLRWLPSTILLTLLTTLAHPAAAGVDRWTSLGPDGGFVGSLAADPGVPGTLYAGTEGGVWKSLDGGVSWAPTAEGLGAPGAFVLAASAGRVFAVNSSGLYVLTDGAATWRRVGLSSFDLQALAVDPTNPDRVWVAGHFETTATSDVLVSEDGGEHWTSTLRLSYVFYTLAVAPTVPSTVFAGGEEGIFASRDGGTSWRQFVSDFENFTAPYTAYTLAIDPQDTDTMYATSFERFWKTTDGGAYWSHTDLDEDLVYRLLPLPGALLGLGEGLRRSEDGGDTWERVPLLPAWRFTDFAADPAVPGGAWLSGYGFSRYNLLHTSDSGRTWSRIGRGLRATDIQTFAFDPFLPNNLYAVTFTAGLERSVDDGASWSPTLTLLDIRSLAADPQRPATLYAGTPRGVSASQDRGAHWQRVLQEPQGIGVVAVDPRQPGTIWAAGKRVWRSRDAGRTWKLLASLFDPESETMAFRIFLSPWHPGTLYLIDSSLHLSRSTDGGATWRPIDLQSPTALAFDPTTQDLLYLADFSGSLRKSRDGGKTWDEVASSVGGSLGLTSLLIDPLDPSVFYAGTFGNGVWRSRDKGVTWQPFSAGIIAPLITCLEADPRDPRRLVACTQGGGLLEIRISPGS